MAASMCYRSNSNASCLGASALELCTRNSAWMQSHNLWESDGTSFNDTMVERHASTTSAIDSVNAATKFLEQDSIVNEPTSVLDLQTSPGPSRLSVSLSSQQSFASISDGASRVLQTVTEMLRDEQDSPFLMEAKPNNILDQDILTWIGLIEDQNAIVSKGPEFQNDPPIQSRLDRLHVDTRQYSDTEMNLGFEMSRMESICNPPDDQRGSVHQARPCGQGTISEPTLNAFCRLENQLFSDTTSAGQIGYQQSNSKFPRSLPTMLDGIGALPATELHKYTVVPTAELLKLLSSQNQASKCGSLSEDQTVGERSWGARLPSANNYSSLERPVQPVLLSCQRTLSSGVPQEESGLYLVHLLLACAEAIDLFDANIAQIMLARLKIIAKRDGDPMQRIALYFAEALTERLAIEMAPSSQSCCSVIGRESEASSLERDMSYQAYYQILPFQKFSHFTANQSLLEAVEDYPKVHIVDLNIRQGLQWPSFIQSLAMLPHGPPRLRITAIELDANTARLTGNRLAEFARSVQVPFEFSIIEEKLENFHRGMICPKADEALAVNCSDILHRLLWKEGELQSLLCKVRTLQPMIVTVLEVDADHNAASFMSRFVQALHYYCALFDSLEATLHRRSLERLRIENLCFGAEIRSIVAHEGVNRQVRHLRAESWQSVFLQAGFQDIPVSRYAGDQAQLLLSLYETSDTMPFRLSPEFGGLSLGWQETPVMAVSSWTC